MLMRNRCEPKGIARRRHQTWPEAKVLSIWPDGHLFEAIQAPSIPNMTQQPPSPSSLQSDEDGEVWSHHSDVVNTDKDDDGDTVMRDI